MADAEVSKTFVERRVSSTLTSGTKNTDSVFGTLGLPLGARRLAPVLGKNGVIGQKVCL